jgi:uncharacterized protein YwgA
MKEISQVLSDTKEEIAKLLDNNFQELFNFDFTKKIQNIKNLISTFAIKQQEDYSLNEHILRDIINIDLNFNNANKELKDLARSNCIFLEDCNESIISREVDKEKIKKVVKLIIDILVKSIVMNNRPDELNTIVPIIPNQMIDNLQVPIGIIDDTTFALEKELECLNLDDNNKKKNTIPESNKISYHLDRVNSTMLRKRERNPEIKHFFNGDKQADNNKSISLIYKWDAHTNLIDNTNLNLSLNKSVLSFDSQGQPKQKKKVNFGGNKNINMYKFLLFFLI